MRPPIKRIEMYAAEFQTDLSVQSKKWDITIYRLLRRNWVLRNGRSGGLATLREHVSC